MDEKVDVKSSDLGCHYVKTEQKPVYILKLYIFSSVEKHCNSNIKLILNEKNMNLIY